MYMTYNMANNSQHPTPTVHEKIYGLSYLISRLSYIDKLHNIKYGLTGGGYVVNSGIPNPELHLKWRSRLPTPVKAQSENKGSAYHGSKTVRNIMAIVVGEIAAAPFKRVKLLIQSQNELLKRGRLLESYKGIDDCFGRTIKVEGYLSLWRGNTVNIIRNLTSEGLEYPLKAYFHRRFRTTGKSEGKGSYSREYLLAWKVAANSAGASSLLLLVYSLDYAHTRLANDIVKASSLQCGYSLDYVNKKGGNIGDQYHRQFNGLIDVYKKTLRSDGIAGLYRGFSVSCLGIIVYSGLHFGTYVTLGPLIVILGHGSPDNVFTRAIASFGASACAGLGHHPFDTVRRRMMMTSGEAFKYKNSWDAFDQIIKNEGPKSLFKGVAATFLQSFVRSVAIIGYLAFTNSRNKE